MSTRSVPRLAVPPLPPQYVVRPRLLSALDAVATRALTVVSAGPGAGKTVLLSDWVSRRVGPTAWMSLNPSDDSPGRFWPRFFGALRSTGIGNDQLPALAGDYGIAERWPAAPAQRAAQAGTAAVVVLDDAHVLHDPDILGGLDEIVARWSPSVHLVLAARSDPLLPLHRYRVAGQLAELRAADLAMRGDEARDLLGKHGVELTDAAFETLMRRTEGWSAGLRLSALRMSHEERPAEFVAELAMDQGSVGEYLTEEVLDSLSADARDLLIETSFLPEVTVDLARAVTRNDDAGLILSELARTNSFVVPLDHSFTRFRYHQLLGEILCHLLDWRPESDVSELMRRAAIRHEAAGQYGEAAHWYVNAGDEVAAATLLARGGFVRAAVLGQPLTSLTLRSLAHGSAADRGPTASAEVGRLLAALWLKPPRQAQEQLAEWAHANQVSDHELSVTIGVARVMTARRSGDWPTMASAARSLMSELPEGASWPPGLRAWLLFAGATAESWLGYDSVDAHQEALREAERDGVPEVQLEIHGMLALQHARAARVAHADRAIDDAFACIAEHGELSPPLTLDLAAARRAYLAADLDNMSRAVGRLTAIGSPVDDAGLATMVALTRAELLMACGRVGEARGVLHAEAALDAEALGVPALARDALLADIETTLGRPNAALTLLDTHRGEQLSDRLAAPRARALIRGGETRAAGDVVRGALTASTSGLSRYDVVDAMLCEAQVELTAGDDARAIDLLMQTTEIADGDMVLPFVRMADVFAPLVSRHVALAEVWPLQAAAALVEAEPSRGHQLADPLTDRERTVLRYLGTNMSTAEIAAELFVSVNTVKTHLAAIYRKLAASRRREAVMRARELELL